MAGVLEQIATADGELAVPNFQIGDLMGGTQAAVSGVMAALLAAQRTGVGRFVDISMSHEVLRHHVLAAFTLQALGQPPRDVVLPTVSASQYLARMKPAFPSFVYALPKRSSPLYLRRRAGAHYVTTLDHGRVVFVGYNLTLGSTFALAQKVSRLAKQRKVRRVIVDVRLNPGGDNHTYVPLLAALRSKRINKPGRLVVLIGRSTFSAAENFITELERKTRVTFVGEPSGGSPNLYGDVQRVELPSAKVTVNIAAIWWQKSTARDSRVTIQPRINVPVSSTAYFRGKDPTLAAALAYRVR